MKQWLWAVAVVAAACMVSPVLAQKGFGPKGGGEERIKKLETQLKDALEQIQDLKAQLSKGKEKGAEKDVEKKKEDWKKKFEGKDKKDFGPGGFGKGKDFEKMKEMMKEKMEKMMKEKMEGKMKEKMKEMMKEKGEEGKKKFEGKSKEEIKKKFEGKGMKGFGPGGFGKGFGKGFGPGGFKKGEGKTEAKAATTEELLQQILHELKAMRKEMHKK